MKEFLTEWLLRYGTGVVTVSFGDGERPRFDASFQSGSGARQAATEARYIVDNDAHNNDRYSFQITEKGLAYLKDSSDKPEVSE